MLFDHVDLSVEAVLLLGAADASQGSVCASLGMLRR